VSFLIHDRDAKFPRGLAESNAQDLRVRRRDLVGGLINENELAAAA
jgi:hypothetical protein